MYFYSISESGYDDYSELRIMHTRKFTKDEFIEMYNETVQSTSIEYLDAESITDHLIKHYGFEPSIPEFEINSYHVDSRDNAKVKPLGKAEIWEP